MHAVFKKVNNCRNIVTYFQMILVSCMCFTSRGRGHKRGKYTKAEVLLKTSLTPRIVLPLEGHVNPSARENFLGKGRDTTQASLHPPWQLCMDMAGAETLTVVIHAFSQGVY